ncbi:MAG: hypothetical protein KGL12_04475 [Rhodospirillales bacterium]|nr:hypothetical protein [Rhodospirillales bacterium]
MRLGKHAGLLGLALAVIVGTVAMPGQARAWWRGGWGWHGGVVIGAPIFVPPPVVYAPPPPVVYAPPPPVIYARPRPRIWIPPHWRGPYWVPGHWS